MGKFLIRETASGVKFDLLAANGQVILLSEVYTSRAAALKGIASIRQNAPAARVENQTEEGCRILPHPKFELYRDRAGEYRFRLKARNGKIVGISESYATKTGALNGIESVKTNAAQAETEG
jgi:uncharacterized protein YegP (UPF0339 family)